MSEMKKYVPNFNNSDADIVKKVAAYNNLLNARSASERYVQKPAERILRTPYEVVKKNTPEDEDVSQASSMLDNTRIVKDVVGTQIDKSNIRNKMRNVASVDNYTRAGNIFVRDNFTDSGGIFQNISGADIVDPRKVTRGDLKMFEYKALHPDTTTEELFIIREKTNSNRADRGVIEYDKLGHSNSLRKRVDRLVSASEVNAFEEYARKVAKENPHIFTPSQKQILYREDSLLMAHTPSEFSSNTELIKQVLKNPTLTGDFATLNYDKLNSKDISKLLKGRIPYIDPRQNFLLCGGLRALDQNIKSLNYINAQRAKIARRSTISRYASQKALSTMNRDDNFSSSYNFASKAIDTAKTGVSVAKHTAKASSLAIETTGKLVGKTTVSALDVTGNHAAADILRKAGEGINAAADKVNSVKTAPKKAVKKVENVVVSTAQSGIKLVGKGAYRVGESIGSTKIGSAVVHNKKVQETTKATKRAYRTAKKVAGTAVKTTSLPARLLSATADGFKKFIITPVIIAFGVLILLEIGIAMLGNIQSSTGGIFIIFMDDAEHMQDFQSRYEQDQLLFQTQIDSIINGYAKTLNKKGQPIRYGVNSSGNDEATQSDDYVSGVTLNFDSAQSNNLEDILSCLAIIMQQEQQMHHTEALELLDALYNSSHTYDYTESSLYPCDSGCEITHYNCNENQINFPSSELRFSPWLMEETYVPTSDQECVVCRAKTGYDTVPYDQYAGCTAVSTCYHGDSGDMGKSHSKCNNYTPIYDCPGHESSSTDAEGNTSSDTDYCGGDLGCRGYYECNGHDHFGCPKGHDVRCCYGHCNIVMNVHMKALEELFELGGVETEEGFTENTTEETGG